MSILTENERLHYQRAIDLLQTDADWKAICVKVAKLDPGLFCAAASNDQPYWREKAKAIYSSEGIVKAIKYVREETSLGLKEAKEEVEKLK